MLKKIFSALLLCFALTFVGNSQAEAGEVYVGSYSDGTSVYLIESSIWITNYNPHEFSCKVRAGRDYLDYTFYVSGGSAYYRNSEGYSGSVYGGNSPVAAAIYRYVQQGYPSRMSG